MAARAILPGQLRLIVAIAAVHIVAWYAYLGHIPLGLYPTAQENEIIETAFALAKGLAAKDLSVSVYTFGLSIPARFAEGASELIFIARLINALALILTTVAVAHASGRYWKQNRPIWITGLLTGLNPVLVFWSAEVGPTLLAALCAGLGFAYLLRWLRHPSLRRSLLIGLLLSVGTALETSLIFFIPAWACVAALYPNRKRLHHLGAAVAFPSLALFCLAVSHIQLQPAPQMEWSNLGRGIYETFNNYEVYDGKSFSLHRWLNFFLLLNPVHWGLIFIPALGGAFVRLKSGHSNKGIAALLACLVIFATGYALNEGGSQARALLHPILAIFAGGISMMPHLWRHAGKRTKYKMLTSLLLAAGLCYSDIYGTRGQTNWEADYSFLAKANLAMERSQSAVEWAEKTLEINPARDDMRSIILQATFNEWAFAPSPSLISREIANAQLDAARQADSADPTTRAIQALYLFKLEQSDEALAIWNKHRDRSALALVCLYWTGHAEKPTSTTIHNYEGDPYEDLLQITADIDRNALVYSEAERTLDNMLAVAH